MVVMVTVMEEERGDDAKISYHLLHTYAMLQ